ncbi:MAG: sel1 repeat family protein [Lysobacteraceae bacterium]|nr:MAG: sel1 repeat family protein [Xanthomonadaceae bacterium]
MSKRMILLALLPFSLAIAAEKKAAPAPDPTEDPLLVSSGFLSWHPDLRFRLWGLEARGKKKFEDALQLFQRAAFYGDKPSQGMVAEMYWNGEGTAKDPALAYAWMDLAAERGYVGFLGLRERYWNALDATQRARAISEGQALYARYGDAATTPRIAAQLRRGRSKTTGSRTGSAGNLQIYVPGPGGLGESIDGSKFYDERYWDPAQYRQWHDSIWSTPKVGRVEVGEIQQVGSRIPVTQPDTDAVEPPVPATP